jgi:P pilus assembly chaperone PapD
MQKIYQHLNPILGSMVTASIVTLAIPIQAQTFSMSLSPMVTIQKLNNAQSKATLSIVNGGSTPIRIRIYTQDFEYDKEQGYKKISDHPNSASPYAIFSPKELVIAPGVTRNVRVSVTIPPSKMDGEYRVAIFAQDLTERQGINPENKYKAKIRPQIASIFFISKGNISPELSAVNIGWNRETSMPRLVIKNQGQASAYPEVKWQLKQGKTAIAEDKILGVVLQAGKERAFDLGLPKGLKLTGGNYTFSGEIDNKDGKIVPFSLNLIVPGKKGE